jgi:ribonuclease HI
MSDNILYIYTDGSAVPNPGCGGWAALLEYNGNRKQLHGAVSDTTNQRMELTAAIKAFEAIKPGWECHVTVISDSQYLINGMNGTWKVKSNLDLFQELGEISAPHIVTWEWVKGHNGHPQNEIVNRLAESEATRLYRALGKKAV